MPRSAPRLKIASVVSSICSKSSISSVSDGIPIFLKLECPMTTASQSPVAMHPNSFCPRQPHGRKAQSLLECPAKWRLSDAGEVQSQWMRRAESDARHHNEARHGY